MSSGALKGGEIKERKGEEFKQMQPMSRSKKKHAYEAFSRKLDHKTIFRMLSGFKKGIAKRLLGLLKRLLG